jgi:hypothetical protein
VHFALYGHLASFTIEVPKASHGEYFPDLDLQTKLLAPSGSSSAKQPVIEVLGLYLLTIAWH